MRHFSPVSLALISILVSGVGRAQTTILVPTDVPTIQEAIDAAADGDTIQVAAGTYEENLDFQGKAIALVSEDGAESTIIDGGSQGSVLTFNTGETTATLVSGFTIRNGNAQFGSGINALGASPTIVDNVFESNAAGAIWGNSSSMVLQRNLFRDHVGCPGFGVVAFVNGSSAIVRNNVWAHNACPALNITVPQGPQPDVANNTFVDNEIGLVVDARIPTNLHRYRNNVFFDNDTGVEVLFVQPGTAPTLENSLSFGNGVNWGGIPDPTGTNGNLSLDPLLGGVSADDFRPDTASPLIDAGLNAAVGSGEVDFHGDTRIRDGGSGSAVVDIGAGEYISPPPIVTLTSTSNGIPLGQSITLTWTSANTNSCRAAGAWSGSRPLNGSQTVTPLVAGKLTYKVICTNAGGARAGVAVVDVFPAPVVVMTLQASSILEGGFTILEWTSSDSTSCTATGVWSGPKSTSGSEFVGPPTPGTHVFGLTCVGPGGTRNGSVSLTVIPKPVVTIEINPTLVPLNGSATLTWTATDATGCFAAGDWVGSKPTSGTESVTATDVGNFLYQLTCTGPGGSDTENAVLTVPPPPTLAISVTPPDAAIGESVVLAWASGFSTVCNASGAWSGSRPTSGSLAVSEDTAGTYEYELTCIGVGGTITRSALLTVHVPPQVTISVNPSTITATDPATLTWTSTGTTGCTASNAWAGPMATNSSQSITQSAAGTYSYTLTCVGPGGQAAGSTTLTVNARPPPPPPANNGGGGGGAFGLLELAGLVLLIAGHLLHRARVRLRVVVMALLAALSASPATAAPTLIVGPPVPVGAPTAGTPMNAVAADLNGDGLLDVAVGHNFDSPVVLLNNGTATPFANDPGTELSSTDEQQQVAVGDLDGDGDLDLVAVGFNRSTRLYLNNGTATPFNGVSGTSIGGSTDASTSAAIADVNGDGHFDVALSNTNHILSRVYLNNGTAQPFNGVNARNIGTVAAYAQDVALTDINGDGRRDAIVAFVQVVPGEPTGVLVYLNDGTADPFATSTPLSVFSDTGALQLAVADFNQDSHPDIAASTELGTYGRIHLHSGSAAQPYSAAATLVVTPNVAIGCGGVAAADANGDGFPDVVFACHQQQNSPPWAGALYLGKGNADPFAGVPPVRLPRVTPFGHFTRSAQIADLDDDGLPELLLADDDPAHYYPMTMGETPVANDDAAITSRDVALVVNVLTNDTDADGTINSSSIVIDAEPAHGSTSIDTATGNITYVPDNLYTGTDTFTYTVEDDDGGLSNVATVNLTVRVPPNAGNDSGSTTTNQSVTLNVLSNDASAPGGNLVPSTLTVASAPQHGIVSITATNSLTYQPAPGYNGSDSFGYTVRDNLGATSNVATVTLTVSSPPPPPPPSSGGGGGGSFDRLLLLLLGGLCMRLRGFMARGDAFARKPRVVCIAAP